MPTETSVSVAPQRRRSRVRVLLLVIVIVLLVLIVPPLVQVNRLKGRVVGAMEAALGRPVSVGSVSLRLLPSPGVDLHRLVISEDPAFGYEPMLRADAVTATFRLASIWRGQLELGRLTLKSGRNISPPSVNLVLAPDGRWNIESLLQRTARTPSAPTDLPYAEARPRFPLIEAKGGRINFKIGVEKKVWALTDSDFALSQPSEDEWAFRLAARPMRGDLNLQDTGQVRISGRFRRAAEMHDTPLEISASLQQAQFGELSKFLFGGDRGWRGALDFGLQVSGTPARLKVAMRAAVSDLRRYDVNITEKLSLQLRCTAGYSTVSGDLTDLDCRLPVGSGALLAKGGVFGSSSPRVYDVKLSAENVPLDALLSLARHARKEIPADLTAAGTLNGAFTLRKIEHGPAFLWEGSASTTKGALKSSVLNPEVALPPLTLGIEVPGLEGKRRKLPAAGKAAAQPTRVALAAFPVALGGAAPAEFKGWFSGPGYEFSLAGDAHLARLMQLGRALGLHTPGFTIEGGAKVDLKVAANWLSEPALTGTAQLHNVAIPVRGVNSPLQIATAQVVLAPEQVRLQALSASFPGAQVAFAGSVVMPRGCDAIEHCPVEFSLESNDLTADHLNRLLNPAFAKRAWYRVFGDKPVATLGWLQARGQVSVGRFTGSPLVLTHVATRAELQGGKLTLTELRADLLGGKLQGDWQADFTGGRPLYEGKGRVAGVNVAQLGSLLHDSGMTGTLNGEYTVKLAGWSAAELSASAATSGARATCRTSRCARRRCILPPSPGR
jgi:AsmA protein